MSTVIEQDLDRCILMGGIDPDTVLYDRSTYFRSSTCQYTLRICDVRTRNMVHPETYARNMLHPDTYTCASSLSAIAIEEDTASLRIDTPLH